MQISQQSPQLDYTPCFDAQPVCNRSQQRGPKRTRAAVSESSSDSDLASASDRGPSLTGSLEGVDLRIDSRGRSVQAQSSVAKPSEQRVVILNEFCTRPPGNETKRDLPDPVGIGRCSQSEQGVQPCVALALPRHKHASTNPRRGSFRGLHPSRPGPGLSP